MLTRELAGFVAFIRLINMISWNEVKNENIPYVLQSGFSEALMSNDVGVSLFAYCSEWVGLEYTHNTASVGSSCYLN